MKRSLLTLAAGCAAILVLSLAFLTTDDRQAPTSLQYSQPAASIVDLKPAGQLVREQTPSRKETEVPLDHHRSLRSINSSPVLKIAATLRNRDVGVLIQAAKAGDPASAVSLFQLAYSCSPIGKQILLPQLYDESTIDASRARCQSIPDELRMRPLLSLEEAAEKGSPEAQLIYAHNAPNFAKLLIFSDHTDGRRQSEAMMGRAEVYGKSAAKEGLKEAFELMTALYASGMLGSNQVEKGFAYTLALSEHEPSTEVLERIKYLEQNLAKDQFERARILALGCASKQDDRAVFANPFSS